MVTQIQLRGISRDPSDRMNSDGGCAESLNVQLNNGELAPTPAPDQTTYAGIPASLKVLYIHKTNDYTNYIGRSGSSLYAKIGEGDPTLIASLGSSTDPVGITSIGNILVWNTASGSNYALFRDGAYTYLGTSIPEPTVTFRTTATSEDSRLAYEASAYGIIATFHLSDGDPWIAWNKILQVKDNKEDDAYEVANMIYDAVQENTWAEVDSMRTTMRGNNTFAAPVLARYALKLYDGNYIYISAPVLLTGTVEHDYMRVLMGLTDQALQTYQWRVYANNTFTADVRVDFGSAGMWGDLIESVDIFLSTDICVPKPNSVIRQAFDNGTNVIGSSVNDAGFEMEGVSDYAWLNAASTKNRYKEDFETAMTEKGNFYKVASIPAFTQSYWVEDLKPKAQDDLVVLPRLSEGDAHQISGTGGVGSYNERLILTGEKITLSKGNQRPDCLLPTGAYSGTVNTHAYFYVRTSGGGTKIVKGYGPLNILDKERARAYVTYPDPRCYQAVYYIVENSAFTRVVLPMKEHPRLNAAYGFWGLGYRLDELYTGDNRSTSTVSSISETEDKTYTEENRLYLSEMDNPFVFPLGQRISFSSKILEAVPITIPLSTGQFGQYQLYVFTEEGIWAETITDEGKISKSDPVSRDVPLPGSVCQLDQSVVFASKQGVMMISGASAENISPNMLATRDTLGAGGSLSNLGDWANLMTIAQDGTTFLSFLDGSRFVYDYPGKRFLVFNPTKNYAYIYKIDTGTWHKQQLPSGKLFSNTLNSYPNALVTMSASGSMSVVDFATVLGGSDLRTALVVTRNLNLGESDVRKVIKSIKIRGEYRSGGSAKYILMGSMDGKYFSKLTSLKNGSWKFYKMALLLKLYPDERVSWVDVDFESKFSNKLR